MLCPYCNAEYTAEKPCFCQPAFRGVREEVAEKPEESFEALQALRIRVLPATAG